MWKRVSLLWWVVRGDAGLLWLGLRHPQAPGWLKPSLALVALYLVSPIDLVPDVLPVLGVMDDMVLVPLALAFIVQRLPSGLRADYARSPH